MEAQFLSLEGDFVIRQGTELIEYHKISDIPDKFDHLIKFLPKYPCLLYTSPSPRDE